MVIYGLCELAFIKLHQVCRTMGRLRCIKTFPNFSKTKAALCYIKSYDRSPFAAPPIIFVWGIVPHLNSVPDLKLHHKYFPFSVMRKRVRMERCRQ